MRGHASTLRWEAISSVLSGCEVRAVLGIKALLVPQLKEGTWTALSGQKVIVALLIR